VTDEVTVNCQWTVLVAFVVFQLHAHLTGGAGHPPPPAPHTHTRLHVSPPPPRSGGRSRTSVLGPYTRSRPQNVLTSLLQIKATPFSSTNQQL